MNNETSSSVSFCQLLAIPESSSNWTQLTILIAAPPCFLDLCSGPYWSKKVRTVNGKSCESVLLLLHKTSQENFSNQFLGMILAIPDHDFFSSFSKQKLIERAQYVLNDSRFFQGFQLTEKNNKKKIRSTRFTMESGFLNLGHLSPFMLSLLFFLNLGHFRSELNFWAFLK